MAPEKKTIKITANFIIDEYLKAKKMKGLFKKSAMKRVCFLSQNLNKYVDPEFIRG